MLSITFVSFRVMLCKNGTDQEFPYERKRMMEAEELVARLLEFVDGEDDLTTTTFSENGDTYRTDNGFIIEADGSRFVVIVECVEGR